jgi:hypothetical protein
VLLQFVLASLLPDVKFVNGVETVALLTETVLHAVQKHRLREAVLVADLAALIVILEVAYVHFASWELTLGLRSLLLRLLCRCTFTRDCVGVIQICVGIILRTLGSLRRIGGGQHRPGIQHRGEGRCDGVCVGTQGSGDDKLRCASS